MSPITRTLLVFATLSASGQSYALDLDLGQPRKVKTLQVVPDRPVTPSAVPMSSVSPASNGQLPEATSVPSAEWMERSGPLAGSIGVCNDQYKGFNCFSLRCQEGLVEAIIQTNDLNTSLMLRIDDDIYPIEADPETKDTQKLRISLKQEFIKFHVPEHMFDLIRSSRRLEWSQVVYGSPLDFRKIDVPGEDSPGYRLMAPFEKACYSQPTEKKSTKPKNPVPVVTQSRSKPYQPPTIGGVWDCPVDGITYTINENFGLVNGGGKEVDLSAVSKMGRFVWNDRKGKRATVIIDKTGKGTLNYSDTLTPIKCEWQGTGRMPG